MKGATAILGAALLLQNCLLCDKVGRTNSVKIKCIGCNCMYHKTCLIKVNSWSDAEVNDFRKKNNYICWKCSLPDFNESFWSIPEAPPCPPPQAHLKRSRKHENKIKVVSFNARSLKNRKRSAEIDAFLLNHSADIYAVNETWLQPDVKNHEVLPRDYIVLRNDRLVGRGGGVLLAIRPYLQPKRLQHLEGGAEIVWAEIRISGKRILVGSAYRKPNAETGYNESLVHSLDLVSAQQPNFDGCLLMGDFNLNIMWNVNPPEAQDGIAETFKTTFAEMAFEQLVNLPTRTTENLEKTIDLLLCDEKNLVQDVFVVPGVSDHDAIIATLSLSAVRPISAPREFFDFQRANWTTLNAELAEQLQIILQIEDVTEAWEKWKKIIFDCVEKLVPKKRIGGKNKKKLLPWLNKDLKKSINVRDQLFARWQEIKTQDARDAYIIARRSTQSALRQSKDNWMWRLGQGGEGKQFFWQYINSKASVPHNTVNFEVNGKIVSQPEEIATCFSKVFQENFSQTDCSCKLPPRSDAIPQEQSTLSELTCTPEDICKLLGEIKPKTATGPDGVPAILLKNSATAICVSLSHVFNKSLNQGVPADWKVTAVTPIHKEGSKQNMENYRPIGVPSLVGKTLERFVRNLTSDFLENQNLIPNTQHGFRKRRSCTTLLTGAIDSWTAALDEKSGTHIHCVYLDWSKAFDKVPHARLLSKLEQYGIKGKLLKWFESFLIGRTQYVQMYGARSGNTEVSSGVIQGSVLGPLLFNIYVSDLLESPRSTLFQYADDSTLSRIVDTQEDADALQADLDEIYIWCETNGMSLNVMKCKMMDITHARTPLYFMYNIGGVQLEYVNRQRLLGVHISSDLRWNLHTDIVRNKAAQVLGFVARNMQGCAPRVKRIAYLSLVKPIWTYGLPAWHPTTFENTKKFERLQKRALHFIHGRRLPLTKEQKIMPVPMHLGYSDLIFFKRCTSGATDFDAKARIIEGRVLRGDNNLHPRLQPPPVRSVFGQKAFSFRIVKLWNDLPTALKDVNVKQFPSMYKKYLWDNFN